MLLAAHGSAALESAPNFCMGKSPGEPGVAAQEPNPPHPSFSLVQMEAASG